MSQTFTYTFTVNGYTDHLTVTTATTATNSTPYGLGYNVTAISGMVDNAAISGEVGSGGQVQYTGNPGGYDNTVFLGNVSGAQGSSHGVDGLGLEFTSGSTTYNFYSAGGALYLFNVTSRSSKVVTLVSSDAPCYCRDTLIATVGGETPVQALAAGDVVVTASGRPRVVEWMGTRSFGGPFLAANPGVQPVRFAAGSLGGGLPRRALRVSPEHAMFIDGLLIPARHLVNGTTIVWERGVAAVDYFHVELGSHDVLLAEGAPSESFVDDDSRHMFHNAAEWHRQPGRVSRPAEYCALRMDSGPELEAIRSRLDGARRRAA